MPDTLKNRLKMVEKVKAKPYLFAVFCPFMKNGKVAENGRKVKAIALLIAFFCPFMKNGKSR